MMEHHTVIVPSHYPRNMSISGTASTDFHVHAPKVSDWTEDWSPLWGLKASVFPSPCDSHHASMVWRVHTYFRMISVPDGPLLSSSWFCGRHWTSHKAQSICNGVTWPADSALLPAAAQGILQDPVWEPTLSIVPSPWWCRLELVVGSWSRW